MSISPQMTDSRRNWIAVIGCLSTILPTLDSTIVNVALPFMQGALSASQDQISWVVTSYVLATAIATAATTYVTERFGRRVVFIGSVLGFTIASVLCAMSQTLSQMVLFRILQGVTAASVVPLSQALIISIYPREKLGPAIALWGMGVMIAPVVGPTLGGYLTEMLSWHWIFLINLPLGLICVAGLIILMPDSPKNTDKPFNGLGFAYLAISLGALQLVLDRGMHLDWFESREIVIEALVCGVCFFMFLVDMFTSKHPYLEPAMFRDRNYVVGLTISTMITAILLSTMVLWPLMLQNVLGYPVVTAGLLMIPRALSAIAAMWIAGRLARFEQPRVIILFGILTTAFSLWQSSHITLDASAGWLISVAALQGLGLGFVSVPMSLICYATLDRRHLNQATVFYSMTRNVGSSVGVSVVITSLAHYTTTSHALLTESINPFNANALNFAVNSGLSSSLNSPGVLAMVEGEINRQAAIASYSNNYHIMAVAALCLVFLLLPVRSTKAQNTAGAAPAIPDH